MSTYTINAKNSGTGSIHDMASQHYDREIIFAAGCMYAVVLAGYYGGKGYSTHKTEAATIAAAKKSADYSYTIIDADGSQYAFEKWGNRLIKIRHGGE